jgi:flagellar hook-associated protein 3 FlgL
MKLGTASDLARLQMLQRNAFATRAALDAAAVEMTSGQKQDRFEATGGNLTRLFALERGLERNRVFADTLALSEMRLDIMQEGFGRLLAPVEDLAVDLATATGLSDAAAGRVHAATARRAFVDAVGVLNTRVAGQALFAGAATDRAALAPAEDMLAELDAIAAGAATPADAVAAIEAWFAPPGGGFYATGYVGSTTSLVPVEIGDGARLDYAVRADDAEVVAALRAHALAAVVDGGAFAGDPAAQLEMLAAAGQRMLEAREETLALRARVGVSQNTVERGRAERTSEREALELARAGIVATDPLEAASTYQTLQVQLESIFTVTSRLAELRFTNFLR